jgi:D-3-phosphoglycerate dehydrogenase
MGDIAYQLARLLLPFGCTILAWSPSSEDTRWRIPDPRWPTMIEYEKVEIGEMLERVDVLSIHCPLKAETRHMIGKEELKRLKPEAILINTARGGIVDEKALAEALKEGRLDGAGLDVFEEEPAYGDNLGELGKMDNVICLPHL